MKKRFILAITLSILTTACSAYAQSGRVEPAPTHNMHMMMVADSNPDTAKAVKTSDITISNFTFAPVKISVPVGTKVTWTNKDDTPHRVMVIETKAKSAALDSDASFSTTFDTPGTYHYFCTMHPMMKGAIEVTAAK